jgi:LPXTG-site transpeptidase (sortase) family protein
MRFRKIFKANTGLAAGMVLVALGIVVGGGLLLRNWQTQRVDAKAFDNALRSGYVRDSGPTISGVPARIVVPNVDIDNTVIPGYYYPATKSWTLTSNHAQWASMTAQANNKKGDTFIYAHDLDNLFAPLTKVKKGDKATVVTTSGHQFTYTFRTSVVVTPQNTNLFTYKGRPILILQTCSGLWYQNRQLFIFDLKEVT